MIITQYIYPILLLILVLAFAAAAWYACRFGKGKILDILLIWPMLLRGSRSSREKYFLWIGIAVMILLIVAAQFINK
ncbi:MAG TPA: hypothetical protein VFK08_06115 [Rhodanobacteraceae bacterium]|jgi:hypothetical protein|nr:hypothetical protein [Rhodanobacteraceae bacterium]